MGEIADESNACASLLRCCYADSADVMQQLLSPHNTLGRREGMSCDHSVWFPYKRLTNAEAGALHAALCDGDTSGVQDHPSVDAFYEELVAMHPQIDDISDDQVDDHDLCPWSIAFDRSGGHIIMCCVWSKADYVSALLKSLATKHGLALYDPQSERVHYPDAPSAASKPWWKLW